MFLISAVLLIVIIALMINKSQYGDYMPPPRSAWDDDDL